MHCQIDFTLEQCFFDFLGEKSLAFDFVKTQMLNLITFGFDDVNIARKTKTFELRFHVIGLPKREVASPGADDYFFFQGRKIMAQK
jgi:hypothetical protein